MKRGNSNKSETQPPSLDRYQIQRILDVIDFYRDRGWNPGLVLEFLILQFAGRKIQ